MYTDRGLDKEYVVHIYNGTLFSPINKEIIYINTEGPRDYHTKSIKDKYHKISFICGM